MCVHVGVVVGMFVALSITHRGGGVVLNLVNYDFWSFVILFVSIGDSLVLNSQLNLGV